MGVSDVLLFEDETVLKLFPNLRRAWSLKGKQQHIAMSGRNDQQVLFGTINVQTGRRIVVVQKHMRQEGFQALLRQVRKVYRSRSVWMLLDNATLHKTNRSLAMAAKMHIRLMWLPRQCAELRVQWTIFGAASKKIAPLIINIKTLTSTQIMLFIILRHYLKSWQKQKLEYYQNTFGLNLFCKNFWQLT